MTILVATLGCALIGFADDYLKVRRRRSLGLEGPLEDARARAHHRRRRLGHDANRLHGHRDLLPVIDVNIDLHWSYFPFLFVVIAGTSNGVNLTDGIDGLAAGTCAISLLTLLAIASIDWIRSAEVGRTERRVPRHRDRRRGADRRRDRVPLVQRVPGRGVHGRHRLDGARRRDRDARDHHRDRGAARLHRRHLSDRGALRDDPGRELQAHREDASS